MSERKRISRRTMLTITAVTGTTALAGCPDNDDEEEPDDDPDEEPEAVDVEEWAEIEEFYFDGQVSHWGGIEPDIIENEENPTLTLIEGQEYDFVWTNADGDVHNFAIWDDDGEPIVSSDFLEEEAETTEFVLEATEEMDVYLCETHDSEMHGSIEVRSE